MILYHGTNVDFHVIDLNQCKPNKDFGRGFYLTDIHTQANDMAIRRCEIAQCGTPTVLSFEFDENAFSTGELKVKRFECPSAEWAEFIIMNRKARDKRLHDYDIVIGPVADDGVVYQINLFLQRLITLETLVKELTFKKLNRQYYFGTELAISKLHKI